jgi:pimeloyl-ACP methyl ester carboxylesterase
MNPADARTLLADTAKGRSWIAVAEEPAGRRARAAETAPAAGHRLTALRSYRWTVGAALFAQMAAAIGAHDGARIAAVLGALRFAPARHRIGCPVLALHGGADPFADPAALAPFAEAASPCGELRTWPDGEHTLYHHAAERDALVAD